MRLHVKLVVYNVNKTKCKGFASELWLALQSKIQGTLPRQQQAKFTGNYNTLNCFLA